MPRLSYVGGSVPVVVLGMEAMRTRDKRGRDRSGGWHLQNGQWRFLMIWWWCSLGCDTEVTGRCMSFSNLTPCSVMHSDGVKSRWALHQNMSCLPSRVNIWCWNFVILSGRQAGCLPGSDCSSYFITSFCLLSKQRCILKVWNLLEPEDFVLSNILKKAPEIPPCSVTEGQSWVHGSSRAPSTIAMGGRMRVQGDLQADVSLTDRHLSQWHVVLPNLASLMTSYSKLIEN